MWLLTLLLMLPPSQTGHNLRLRATEYEPEEILLKQEYYKDNVYLLKPVDEANGKIPKFPFPKVGKKDTCDYTKQHKCGDLCIDGRRYCGCGDQVFSMKGFKHWHCCVPPSTTAQCYDDGYYMNGVCPNGTTLGNTQQCNGQCYNQYSQELNTSALSTRSMYQCDNGDCRTASTICRGYARCMDKSDLRACNSELTCVSINGVGHVSKVSTINSDLVDGHSLCLYSKDRNEGQYDSITREDEDNLDIVSTSAVNFDFTKLEHCNTSISNNLIVGTLEHQRNKSDPGVMCGTRCLPSSIWCRYVSVDQCDDGFQIFTTDNPELCRNSAFWRDVPCTVYYPGADIASQGLYYSGGDIASHGLRCTGAKQQCIYPWYVTSNFYYEAGFMVMTC